MADKQFKADDAVWLSSLFLRSIGGFHPCAETKGKVVAVEGEFCTIQFGRERRIINSLNLVHDADKAKEARDVEHRNLAPSVQIGARR